MNLSSLLYPATVRAHVQLDSKKALFPFVGDLASRSLGLDAGADHLKALAGVSRMLRNEAIADRLRGAKNDEALYALLADTETRDAA